MPLLATELENIRNLTGDLLFSRFQEICSSKRPGPEFLGKLDTSERETVYRCCLLLSTVTNGEKIPREFQLKAVLTLLAGKDCLIDAGTGSGKTLCMILPALLDPTAVSLVVSPLKRLQVLQVAEFQSYGLTAACINEDTPNSTEFWKSVQAGDFTILIVQPEQLQPFGGHLPRLAQVLRNSQFSKLIKRTHVDEAHTIYTAGIPLYGQPAFRAAWGNLGELRLLLRKNTPFQALSGTLPPHITNCVTERLLFPSDYVMINLTSNRPNITYATYPITGLLSNFQNLQFLVPEHGNRTFDPKIIPKTIIFHDNLHEAANAANYLNSLFPETMRRLRLVKHYHSNMSTDYLEHTFQDFASPDGTTRILCATSGASTGLDVLDINCVIQYGLCRDIPNGLRRCGRCGRAASTSALFLILYEPWAMTADLSSLKCDLNDPDQPLQALTKTSKKPERTGAAMYQLIQSSNCIRRFFANYLCDGTPTAVDFTNQFCCDRHGDGFNLFDFFPGKIRTAESLVFVDQGVNAATSRPKYRPVKEREPLKATLYAWRSRVHRNDPLRGTPQTSLTNVNQLKTLVGAGSDWAGEWGQKIVDEICSFDAK
ncbi:P-loop containing nucleoside triphosphate hydrolase protein [Russula emetica]|nr:P-loop containing nucleoside triphosphate hydrolase protein [Russula emetica]